MATFAGSETGPASWRGVSTCLAASNSASVYGAARLFLPAVGTSSQKILASRSSPKRLQRPKRCTKLDHGANSVKRVMAERSRPASTTCVAMTMRPSSCTCVAQDASSLMYPVKPPCHFIEQHGTQEAVAGKLRSSPPYMRPKEGTFVRSTQLAREKCTALARQARLLHLGHARGLHAENYASVERRGSGRLRVNIVRPDDYTHHRQQDVPWRACRWSQGAPAMGGRGVGNCHAWVPSGAGGRACTPSHPA
jgi:hypothetical protein